MQLSQWAPGKVWRGCFALGFLGAAMLVAFQGAQIATAQEEECKVRCVKVTCARQPTSNQDWKKISTGDCYLHLNSKDGCVYYAECYGSGTTGAYVWKRKDGSSVCPPIPTGPGTGGTWGFSEKCDEDSTPSGEANFACFKLCKAKDGS